MIKITLGFSPLEVTVFIAVIVIVVIILFIGRKNK